MNKFDALKNNFVELTNVELMSMDGGNRRDYSWGYSIGKTVRDGIDGTVKFFQKLF